MAACAAMTVGVANEMEKRTSRRRSGFRVSITIRSEIERPNQAVAPFRGKLNRTAVGLSRGPMVQRRRASRISTLHPSVAGHRHRSLSRDLEPRVKPEVGDIDGLEITAA